MHTNAQDMRMSRLEERSRSECIWQIVYKTVR
jgi:hypothetical protein